MASQDPTSGLGDALVIDGLNVSNWDSPSVFRSLHSGPSTQSTPPIVVWENYRETMDNIAAWLQRFRTYQDTLLSGINRERHLCGPAPMAKSA